MPMGLHLEINGIDSVTTYVSDPENNRFLKLPTDINQAIIFTCHLFSLPTLGVLGVSYPNSIFPPRLVVICVPTRTLKTMDSTIISIILDILFFHLFLILMMMVAKCKPKQHHNC